MNERIARKLSDAFVTVRDCYNAKAASQPYPKSKLKTALWYIDDICIYINRKCDDTERDFLFSCLGAFDKLKAEGDIQKISDFANAVHRIPFIFCDMEKWDDEFRSKYIIPFCTQYGNEWLEEIIDIRLPKKKNKAAKGKAVYRYNETNIMSLPMYFGYRMLVPLLTLPFIIGCIIFVRCYDYTEKNHGKRYDLTVASYEYENSDKYDYLYIKDKNYKEQFEISRFFQYSNSPENLIEKCEKGEHLIVYAEYVKPQKYDNYYRVIQVEDTDGNVYRSYSQTNMLDKYMMQFLQIAFLVIFMPFFVLFVLMLIVALNRKKFVSHPRFVKFCFPDYSLSLKK